MNKKNALLIAAGLVFSATLIASAQQVATEIARVNNSVISVQAFNEKYRENLKFFQFRTPSKKEVLDDMIKRELGIQEARRLGLDKDPEVVDRMNTVLYHALLDKQLSKQVEKINVTDDQAKAYYTKNPEIRTSHIFVALAPDATQADQKRAYDKIKKIQDTHLKDGKMSFAEVAQRFSEGVAAPMGGDIDYQTRDKLDPAYYEAALALKRPGRVSGIVRTQFGYHIIRLTAIRPWDETDRAQAKRQAFEELRTRIFEQYIGQLRSRAKISVRDELLK